MLKMQKTTIEIDLKNMIKKHEGFRPFLYKDTLGYLIGGYGHAFLENSPLSQQVSDMLFEEDFKRAENDCNTLCAKYNLLLNSARRAIITDMLFNMGISKFLKFKKFIAALQNNDYKTASIEMLDSLWAGQVKGRAKELSEIMSDGEKNGS